MRIVERSYDGNPCSTSPSATSTAARRAARTSTAPRSAPASSCLPNENAIATPTMNRKYGKIRSVGVQPCHAACSSGGYTCAQLPGLLTSSIAAIVAPRNTSSECSRAGGAPTIGTAGGAGAAAAGSGAPRITSPPRR
jgi:hypothetical protein